MRLVSRSIVVLVVLAVAASAFAGDPIPDVDVILEQLLGRLVVEVSNGAPFDRLTLGGSRSFVGDLQPERLPSGWVMTREGKRVVLSGPAVSKPTRIELGTGRKTGRTVDKTVDWDVSLAGRELASRKNVVPRPVPPRVVRNSLQGVVVMPEQVSPGEAVGLRPLPGADLPPGHFVLSGVVMEPFPEDDPASGGTGASSPLGDILKSMVTAPRAGFVLAGAAGAPCAEMLPLAAVLIGAGSTGACASCKSFYESRSNTANRAPKTRVAALAAADTAAAAVASWDAAEIPARAASGAGHEVAKGAIRDLKALKALHAVAPSGGTGEGTAAFTIDQKGVKLWEFTPPGGSPERLRIHERPPSRPAAWVALEIAETPSGCLVSARAPDLFDLSSAMQAQKPRHTRPEGKPGLPEGRPGADAAPLAAAEAPRGPLSVGRIPEEVLPGTTIALQYVDLFGDVVVDVPAVAGTEIVPPTAESEPPCVTAATAFAQAEDTVCVCGNFPGVAAQAGLWIDERHAGHAASLSTRTLQVELPPHARTPGRHIWSGDPAAGYLPSCRAWTQVVEIAGAIDSQRLFSSESTPMRLTVAGTTDRVPLEIRNLTPGIVRIDGGERQTVESSGGTPNTVTRSVQGLVRGDFKIEWSLAHDRCPCP